MRAVQQTLQVTKAMNLISTAKLRKGRRVLEDTEPFFNRIQASMYDIVSGAEALESDFFARPPKPGASPGESGQAAVVVITSDKGLAGGYNANIFRRANQLCTELHNPTLILIGAVGYRYFAHSPYMILENFSFRSRLPDVEDAQEIAEYVISQYLWGLFDEVHIVYTHMHSAIKLLPTARQILPLDVEKLRGKNPLPETDKRAPWFEYLPSEAAVFEALVPMYIKGIIYGCLVEAYAGEQSARMSAMDEATKSAEEMLASLQIHYNRVRQSSITQEMTEIISGSAALD
jgi:F-type H+-transporting ATPase subunit gamma